MSRRTKLIAAAACVVAALGIGTGIAVATGGDDAEVPIRGEALGKASAAALAHTGTGRVTDTEVGDEEAYYEVEVTLDGGRVVDVELDERFQVVGSQADDGPEDDSDDND